jgi:hypothetical protein
MLTPAPIENNPRTPNLLVEGVQVFGRQSS